jgi:hypothetical protein
MSAVRALVLHSPLVGPTTVRPFASALTEAAGWSTVAPDLRDSTQSPSHFWQDAVRQCPSADVVIGHSGAGAFLPVVSDALGATPIFIDAVLPGAAPVYVPSQEFLELLVRIPCDDGLLAPWHEWWPPATMVRLVPDDCLRAAIMIEAPRLPRAFYAESVPLPTRWWTRPAGYLQLSASYDDERLRAEQWGWPTRSSAGGHLDLAVSPGTVAQHVIELVGAASRSAQSDLGQDARSRRGAATTGRPVDDELGSHEQET